MSGIIDDLKRTYQNGGAVVRLIFINSIVFIALRIVFLFFKLSGHPYDFPFTMWLSMPSVPAQLLLRPWTLITYMFYHEDILHFLFNMLNLYWFGKIFMMYFDARKMINVYLLGGVVGGLVYFAFYNLFPTVFGPSILMGASASIIALMTVSAFYAPNMRLMMVFIGEIKLIYIWLFSVIMYVILIASDNAGGNLAHLGGALFGYLWIKQFRKGKDISLWLTKAGESIVSLFKRRKMKVTYKRPVDDKEYNRQKTINQQEIDRILDKISKGGYDSLTKDEKDTLFRMSK
jgi:membrane associated rhomboid family serine protease